MQSDCVCVICLEALVATNDDDDSAIRLGCNHCFHRLCIINARNDCCPLCRRVMRPAATGLSAQELGLMRKRKREDGEAADRAAAEEALSSHYIGPGTERYRLGWEALLREFGSPEAMCELEARDFCRRGHKLLHKGVLAQKHVTCMAVKQFVLSVRLLLLSRDPPEVVVDYDAKLVEWIAERLPANPPAAIHEMLGRDGNAERASIDTHIRVAWRQLAAQACNTV